MLFYLLAHDTSLCVRPRVRGNVFLKVFRRVPPCDVYVPGRRGRHADAPGTRPARSYSPLRSCYKFQGSL